MNAALVRTGRWITEHLILFVALMVLLYLFLPIFVVVLMSFDDTAHLGYQFSGFTLANWTDPCAPFGLCSALTTSLQIGLLATIGATVLGTLMAFALVRHRFRGRGMANVGIFLPMASPEIVLGSSLLALFVSAGFSGQLGFATILVAHIMFCLSFVVVTVKARLTGMDSRLEQAAMDLYANEWQTFRLITLPLAMPGIVAAAMLSFSLSFDDFIVTNFTAGQSVTFPLYVYGSKLKGFAPQLFVVGTVMFLISFLFVIAAELWRRRRPT